MVFIQRHLLRQILSYSLKALFLASLFFTSPSFAEVGEVSFQTKQAQITRGKDKILTQVGTPIEMGDEIETLAGKVRIVFIDNTKVNIDEYSTLLIDEFVYDGNTKKGKLNLKAKIGTLRYTSGLLAKNNKENIKITTPTASVSVRGTDFEVTVKEGGESTFTLLPSIDANGNTYTGIIEVSNAAGSVVLNTAYEITEVKSSYSTPSAPIVDTVRQTQNTDTEDIEDTEEENTETQEEEITEEDILIEIDDNTKSVFIEKDGKMVFVNDEANTLQLILDKDANVSLKYDNKGVITEANLNSGSSVLINITQQ